MVALAVIATAMPCCNLIDEYPEESNPEISANLRITLSVPQTKAPKGDENPGYNYDDPYQHEGSDNTLMINDLDFYFFNPDGSFVTLATGFENVALSPDTYTANGQYHRYTADIKVEGVADNRRYRVVVVANRMKNQYGFVPFSVQNTPDPHSPDSRTDEEYLYSQLVFDTCNPDTGLNSHLSDYTGWNLSGYDYARVPMWGVLETELKVRLGGTGSLESSGEIYLLRSIAKVKISLGEELSESAKITDHIPGNAGTGAVLNYKRGHGLMSPSYTNAASGSTTWNSAGKDRSGSRYVDTNVNTTSGTGNFKAPLYKDTDGSYYIYLPEQKIGEAFISIQFQYLDENLKETITTQKVLQFADYVAASEGKEDIPRTEEELADFKFPVMRNHYYIYTVIKLDPLELKYEVCEWQYKSTEIEFN